jgi:hypothetical protein
MMMIIVVISFLGIEKQKLDFLSWSWDLVQTWEKLRERLSGLNIFTQIFYAPEKSQMGLRKGILNELSICFHGVGLVGTRQFGWAGIEWWFLVGCMRKNSYRMWLFLTLVRLTVFFDFPELPICATY